MNRFNELTDRCVIFTLNSLNEINEITIEALQTSGATSLVKTLQMISLQKVILVVGMFFIFEANLQESLKCKNGFEQTKKILLQEGKLELRERFENVFLAINVLKHGHGRSYDALILKAEALPFRVKLPNESFFCEGDVSEIPALIEVTDEFIQHCSNVISDVSALIRRLNF